MKQREIRIDKIPDKKCILNQLISKSAYNIPLNKTIKVISLFSGCGGLDLGFEGGFDVPKACVRDTDFIDFEKGEKILLK
jgi:DNA (cytosine-5)-methyltransferase 1